MFYTKEPAIFIPVLTIGTSMSPTDMESASPAVAIGCLAAILDTLDTILSFFAGPAFAIAYTSAVMDGAYSTQYNVSNTNVEPAVAPDIVINVEDHPLS